MKRTTLLCAATLTSTIVASTLAQADSLSELLRDYLEGRVANSLTTVDRAADAARSAMNGQPIVSFNEWFNQVRKEAESQRSILGSSLKRDPQDWINWSGTNVFSVRQTSQGLDKLQKAHEIVRRIEADCNRLEQLAILEWTKDSTDALKSAGENMTSLKIGDLAARAEALKEITALREAAHKASVQLGTAIEGVSETLNQMIRVRQQYDRDRFEKMERELFSKPGPLTSVPRMRSRRHTTGAATVRAWESAAHSSNRSSDVLRPLPNPIADLTEYRAPVASSRGGSRRGVGSQSGGVPAWDPDFFSDGGRAGADVYSDGGRYTGPARELNPSGGWPESAPSPSAPGPGDIPSTPPT